MILGDTANGKANTEIAKISFKINSSNVSNKESTNINLKNLIITDGDFEISSDKQITINLTNEKTEGSTQKVEQVKEITSLSAEEPTNSISSTTQNTVLPKAGIRGNLIIAIIVLLILTVIFKIKSRKIKY